MMRLEFTPRRFLRLVSLPLLRAYFERRRLLSDFDWDGVGGDVDPLCQAWMGLPAKERHACWVDFETAFGLFSRRGIQTLLDSTGSTAERDKVLATMGKGTLADKVFRVLLDHPEVFALARRFAWADGLKRHWQPRQDLPAAKPQVNDVSLSELKEAVADRYRSLDGRGEYSKAEAHWRGEALYVMVYISDHPEAVEEFEDSDDLKRLTRQRAFDVVYRYEPASGAFEMYADGDKEFRRGLAQDFVDRVLKQAVALPADEVLYFDLEKLKNPEFRFVTDGAGGVRSMELRSIRLSAPGADGGRITFGTPPRASNTKLHSFIRRSLNEARLPLDTLAVEQVTISAQVANGTRRPSSVTFQISSSNTCNLKDTLEHNKIRTCLKRSGVIRGQAAGAAPQTN